MTVLRDSRRNAAVLVACAVALAACGGGGGSGSSGGAVPANSPPAADAGSAVNALGGDVVRLSGSGTDPDPGDVLSFSWTQTAGPAVTLADADTANPSFVAPAVAAQMPNAASVTLSGELSYEFVPAQVDCQGLNMSSPEERPIRKATVQVLDQSSPTELTFRLTVSDGRGGSASDSVDVRLGAIVAATTSDDGGGYSVIVPEETEVSLRVRAELKDAEPPSWDVEVRDNTLLVDRPLAERPIYALDGGRFNSGNTDLTRNLLARTGWDGTAYTRPRAAAPFAVMDAVYTAMQLIRQVDGNVSFTPLDIFWSVNNTTARPDEGANVDTGEIGTSFYQSGIDSLFLLGKANDDTEEFDDHVVVHEWGHYFEDVLSRSDSIGGQHGFGDRLDMRVAFGEGWATALSGIALQSPVYCDTLGASQSSGFEIDIERDSPSPRGWFNEFSIMALIYDLWDDSPAELTRGDIGTIGFQPIFDTMTGPQRTTASHTSIFSFLSHLVDVYPAAMSPVSELRTYHGIDGTGIYGANETNDSDPNGEPKDVLPVYTEIMPNGTPVNICSNRQFDSDVAGNRLSEFRFLRMTVPTASQYTFDVATDADTLAMLPPDDPDDDRDQSDPDILYYRNGLIQNRIVNGDQEGTSGVANRETFTSAIVLEPGDYVMDIVEWRHLDEQTDKTAFPARSCFDVTITPAP